ncbi:MAG: multiheme c-type cytochrome [Candidatus Eisenbacteria bacterium]
MLQLLVPITVLALTGCEKTTEVRNIVQPDHDAYVGSSACQACHPDVYAKFVQTGHSLILSPASQASEPGHYPFADLPGPPVGRSWSDVSYVIGGFWWKVLFVDNQGRVITGNQAQYNVQSRRWVAFESGSVVPYDCGSCHTTGYRYEGHQGGMEGVAGTWALDGVQCERCHGPGSKHAEDPYVSPLRIDRSVLLCGECHSSGNVSLIPASGGFTGYHQEYNEMHATKKISFACVDCHDPHVSVHESSPTGSSAIRTSCMVCHFREAAAYAASDLPHFDLGTIDCMECHMPYAGKVAEGQLPRYRGDVRSHLFRINTAATATMFTSDGKYANGYITLEFACLRCHLSKTREWAGENAPRVHPY